jgi:mutator family transposase
MCDCRSASRSLLAALPRVFLRNALDYLPRKLADDCLIELRWLYDWRNAEEARRDLAAWLLRAGASAGAQSLPGLRLPQPRLWRS